MKNSRFFHAIIQMQYVPRWHEHSPRYKDNAASHSFRCAAIAVLIGIIQEQIIKQPVDKLELAARALLHDLNETVTGSIKHNTKKDAIVAAHIRQLETEVSKDLVSCLSRSMQGSFYNYIVLAEDDSDIGALVKQIDTLDAYLFCKREHEAGSSPYFSQTCQALCDDLQQTALPAVKWFIQALEQEPYSGLQQLVHHIVNLDLIERWGGSFNLIPDNDATHSFRVAAMTLFNSWLETERFGSSGIDHFRALAKSLYHDLVESISGDVASPIKKSSLEIKAAFEQYEHQLAVSLVEALPISFHEPLTDFIVHAKDKTYEGELTDISDKLDALIKSNLEMRNNPHYGEIYYAQLTQLQHHYENPSVIFFLAYILHDLTFDHFVR